MVFPGEPLKILTEVYIDGNVDDPPSGVTKESKWVNITPFVYARDRVRITRGQQNEATQTNPGSMQCTLNNRDGRFTPRNPLSPYYGKIGLSTPVRNSSWMPASVPSAPNVVDATRARDTLFPVEVATPTHSAGDHIYVIHEAFVGAGEEFPSSHPNDDMSWELMERFVNDTGDFLPDPVIHIWRKVAGANEPATITMYDQGLAIAISVSDAGIRGDFAFFVGSGSGTTFELASRTPLTDADLHIVLAIYDGSATTTATPPASYTEHLDVGADFDGTALASRQLTTDVATGDQTYTFSESVGREWSLSFTVPPATGGARFTGEMVVWPQMSDISTTDIYTQIQGSGILRRLERRDPIAQVVYKDFLLRTKEEQNEFGGFYYPFDEESGFFPFSTVSGVQNFNPYRNRNGSQSWEGNVAATQEGATLSSSIPGGVILRDTRFEGANSINPGSTEVAYDLLFRSAGMGPFGMEFFIHSGEFINTDGDRQFEQWFLRVQFNAEANNQIEVRQVTFSEGGSIGGDITDPVAGSFRAQSSTLDVFNDDQVHHMRFLLIDDNPEYDFEIFIDGSSVLTGTTNLPSNNGSYSARSKPPDFQYRPGESHSDVVIGHLISWVDEGSNTIPALADIIDVVQAFSSETAGRRIQRIAAEAQIPISIIGDPDDTPFMGPQPVAQALNVIRECVDVDGGVLYESRSAPTLVYRTLRSMFNQTAVLELDYAAGGELGAAPQSVNDDQNTVNDLLVESDVGQFRQTVTRGPNNVSPPPAGIDRYPGGARVNVPTEKQLPDQASWRIALGTVDEDRFPSIVLNLVNAAYVNDVALVQQALTLDSADKLTLANLPDHILNELVRQLAFGFAEDLWNFGWQITLNTTPGSPYEIGEYGSVGAPTHRYDAFNSRTVFAEDEISTVLQVRGRTPDFQGFDVPWTQIDVPFDIEVNGERMTVTSVPAPDSSNRQDMTVTRSVNGVVRSHPIDSLVRLWNPARYGR